jgi:predicted DNA binding protein
VSNIIFENALEFPMSLYDVKFKIMFNDDYSKLTRKYPSLKIFFWCNSIYDVIELFVDNPKDYPSIRKEIPHSCSLIEEESDEDRFHLVVKNCSCCKDENSVDSIGEDLNNILLLSPVIIENGWEEHHAIVFDHKDFEELMDRLEEKGHVVKVVRKVPFGGTIAGLTPLTRSTLFPTLTEKQASALLTAHRSGYYKLPRTADVKTIAAKQKIARTTFQDHLRKAECKVISTMIPQIQLLNQFKFKKRRESRQ